MPQPAPWIPEIELTEATIAQLLSEKHPEYSFLKVEKFAEGWDNEVYLIDDKLLFRIAKRELGITLAETEIRALPQLRSLLSFPIPELQFHGIFQNQFPYFAYPFMQGNIASDCGLSQDEKGKLVEPIANFLKELHQIPAQSQIATILPKDTLGRTDIPKRLGQIQEQKQALKNSLNFDWEIVNILRKVLKPKSQMLTQSVVHGDFHIRNFLVGESTKLAGIIDWGDVHWGNPAKDLALAIYFFNRPQLAEFMKIYPFRHTQLFEMATMCAINLIFYLIPYAKGISDNRLLSECLIGLKHIKENFWEFSEWD